MDPIYVCAILITAVTGIVAFFAGKAVGRAEPCPETHHTPVPDTPTGILTVRGELTDAEAAELRAKWDAARDDANSRFNTASILGPARGRHWATEIIEEKINYAGYSKALDKAHLSMTESARQRKPAFACRRTPGCVAVGEHSECVPVW